MPATEIESQCDQILAHLKEGKTISPMEALRQFGCFRLGARIWDLKQDGYVIGRDLECDGHKRWARYKLLKTGRRAAAGC